MPSTLLTDRTAVPVPYVPRYHGPCLTGLLAGVRDAQHGDDRLGWIPQPVQGANAVVVLVVDGLGWRQLPRLEAETPTLRGMDGNYVDSVAPPTTAAALTSITTGVAPATHGIVGFRMYLPGTGVLQTLHWTLPVVGDARVVAPPSDIQPVAPFGGRPVPVLTKARFAGSGFTGVHLRNGRLDGWETHDDLVRKAVAQVRAGEQLVYAYTDVVDHAAHLHGQFDRWREAVAEADRLVACLLGALPAGTAVVVTADHGHVQVGEQWTMLHPAVLRRCQAVSGEARLRWLVARPGQAEALLEACRRFHGDVAWVRTRDEVIADGWLGPEVAPTTPSRLGDVCLAVHAGTVLVDAPPGDQSHHGSLTAEEVQVPLLAAKAG